MASTPLGGSLDLLPLTELGLPEPLLPAGERLESALEALPGGAACSPDVAIC